MSHINEWLLMDGYKKKINVKNIDFYQTSNDLDVLAKENERFEMHLNGLVSASSYMIILLDHFT